MISRNCKSRKLNSVRRTLVAFVIICILCFNISFADASIVDINLTDETEEVTVPKLASGDDYQENAAIITLDAGLTSENVDEQIAEVDDSLQVEKIVNLEDSTVVLVTSEDKSATDIMTEMAESDDVSRVEPDMLLYKATVSSGDSSDLNDTYYDYQSYLNDNHNSAVDSGYSSELLNRVSTSADDTPVVVVADTGVNASHEDLKDSMYSTKMYSAEEGKEVAATDDDSESHGTSVASIIAGTINNNAGIAGVSKAKILAVDIFETDESGESYSNVIDVIAAYNYIIKQKKAGINIKAINMSVAGEGSGTNMASYLKTFDGLLTQAGKLGIVTVCAAGNEMTNTDDTSYYPGAMDNDYIINVGASNREDKMASFTNYGIKSVDVFAPGVENLAASNTSAMCPDYNHEIYYEDFENYDVENGKLDASGNSINKLGLKTSYTGCSGTVSIANNKSAGNVSGDSQSIKWTISNNDSVNGTAYVAVPFVLDEAVSGPFTIAARVLATDNSGRYVIQGDDVNFTSGLRVVSSGKEYGFPVSDYCVSCTDDCWVDYGLRSSNSLSTLGKGTYYMIFEFSGLPIYSSYTVYIDNLAISAQSEYYAYESGTSLAAPIVAGEVALLSSIYPDYDATDLIYLVEKGVDRSSAYIGKCTTGGRINIMKAATLDLTPDKARFTQTSYTLEPLKSVTVKANIYPTHCTDKKVTYKSSNSKYAKVDANGKVTALKAGNGKTVTIIATLDSDPGVTAACVIKIFKKATKLKLSKTKKTIKAGKSFKLKATVGPALATNKKVKWSVSNKKYAKVNKYGKVTTKKAGKGHKVYVYAQTTDGSKLLKKCKVTIK